MTSHNLCFDELGSNFNSDIEKMMENPEHSFESPGNHSQGKSSELDFSPFKVKAAGEEFSAVDAIASDIKCHESLSHKNII